MQKRRRIRIPKNSQNFLMVGRLAFSGRERSWVHNSTNENRIRKATVTAAAELMNDWNVIESASSAKTFHMGATLKLCLEMK